MIFLEIKYDHQGFTVVIGCEFCTLWGDEGMHDIKRGKICAIRLHTDCMYSEMLPYKKKCYCLLPLVSHSVHLSEEQEG